MAINPDLDALEKMISVGFATSAAAIRRQSEVTQAVARATYNGHTANGKARYADDLATFFGSNKETAEYLGLSEGRISQLRKTARQNGK
jgi:glutamate-1-semialdehyde aminotransferase